MAVGQRSRARLKPQKLPDDPDVRHRSYRSWRYSHGELSANYAARELITQISGRLPNLSTQKLYRAGGAQPVLKATKTKNKYPATVPVAGYYHRGAVSIHPRLRDIPI